MPAIDTGRLAQLIPTLLMQLKGNSVGAAAFAQGFEKGRLAKQEQRMKEQQLGIQQQSAQRQDEYTNAQIRNMEEQRTQGAEQLKIQRATAALGALDKGFGGIVDSDPTDMTAAENAALGVTSNVESMYGLPEASLSGRVGQIGTMMSARNKRMMSEAAKRLVDNYKDNPEQLEALANAGPEGKGALFPVSSGNQVPAGELLKYAGYVQQDG
jgi:hypothetical protein